MSLKEVLQQDLKTAMKEKDSIRKSVITMTRAGILQIEKDKKIELDDEGVIEVIAKGVKQR
ncbi:MAG: yqey-like protein, partial [Clostridia bacterium]|nr:yqey-like protein [Clostridia bacterium]